jgi:hypothetical protein
VVGAQRVDDDQDDRRAVAAGRLDGVGGEGDGDEQGRGE